MARPKKQDVELVSKLQEQNKEISTEQNIELIYKSAEKEKTIFDKYRLQINEANGNYLMHYQYGDLIEMLRYCERVLGHPIPMNLQCSSCVISLVQMFARLE